MAQSPFPPSGDARTQPHSADGQQPHLRIADDPADDPSHISLDDVIHGVERLTHGIDHMIRQANASSIGSDDDLQHEDGAAEEEPMMAMFDEEAPASIQELDHALSSQADALLSTAMASASHGSSSAMADDDEVILQGECDDIASLLTSHAVDEAHAVTASTSAFASKPEQIIESGDEGEHEHTQPPDSENVPVLATAMDESVMTHGECNGDSMFSGQSRQLSLEPTQAAGIAAAFAAAAFDVPKVSEVNTLSDPDVRHDCSGQAPSSPGHESPAPDMVPVRAAISSTAGAAPTRVNSTSPAIKDAKATPLISVISMQARLVLAATNLPLRCVPESLRPVVNILAISLAIWAPITIVLGPRMADARQTAPITAIADQQHHTESTLKTAAADAPASGH